MNYDEYYELFGPPAPLVKFVLPYAGRRKIPSMICPSWTWSPSSPWSQWA